MIRVRYPVDVDADEGVPRSNHVVVTSSATVVAAEGEKNSADIAAAVDRTLRPLFAGGWSGAQPPPLFYVVNIETRSGCNHECSFCPVSRSIDPRPPGELDMTAIDRIAGELGTLSYRGRIGLFGNNEPLLDSRMPQIVRIIRSSCPEADVRILSNGTKAKPELVRALFDAGLSTLVINNYSDGRRLIGPVRRLIAVADQFEAYDIRISVRDRTQTLTTRAGLAPNKPTPEHPPRGFCALPFTDLHVSYTGDVNLCCFDAHGRTVMGNVMKQSLMDIWTGAGYSRHRSSLLSSVRASLPLCGECDFDGFRAPTFHAQVPMTRQDLVAADAQVATA